MGRVEVFLKNSIKALPPIRRLSVQRDDLARSLTAAQGEISALKAKVAALGEIPWTPNGHFYSPVPPRNEVEAFCASAFESIRKELPDIDLREADQLKFVELMRQNYSSLPFKDEKVDSLRYQYLNEAFAWFDAIALNTMLRHMRPKRVIEVGSGHSSCMLLDTNELWFDNSINCSFIEPYPDLLLSLLKPGDLERITIYPTRIQDVPLDVFTALEANDILFIDSTHVSRVGSDVNRIVFEILPALASGVVIHFHDIFHPFEYPRSWLEQGRAWNEDYLLRAFLQNNRDYQVLMFNSFMGRFHRAYLQEHMPLCLNCEGGSLWLVKK